MLTGRRSRRHRLDVNAEINLINLVDLAFVLLIIFMITAPMLQSGIELQLPKTAAQPVTSDEGVIVSVNRSGNLFVGSVPIASMQELERMLPSYLRAQGKKEVFVRGDENVVYGKVLQVLGRLKELDVAEVTLMIEPEAGR